MDYHKILEWFSGNIIEQKSGLYLCPNIWEHVLSFEYITSPYWKQGCWHSKILKNIIPDYEKNDSLEWYGHYWILHSVPWVDSFWSGNRGLEYEEYPLNSSFGFQITQQFVNNEICYYGVNDSNELFPLTEPFPEWCSKIIKQLKNEPDLILRQIARIHLN